MKLSRTFKRCVAGLCVAGVLASGMTAFALAPVDAADTAAPAELSVSNSVTASQLSSTLSKFTVSYNKDQARWQIDSPAEEASLEKVSCGAYPFLFLTKDDPTLYLNLGFSCYSSSKLDMKTVRIETEDSIYEFPCDDTYSGFRDKDSGIWFDYEVVDMNDDAEWLNEWLSAKSVVVTFIGRDGTQQKYTMTKENLQAIRDVLSAYNTLLDTDADTAVSVLGSIAN